MAAFLRAKTKYICFILLSFTFISLSYAQTNQGMSIERLSRIDNVMKDYIDRGKLSGNVIYILRNGQPVYYKSFGLANVDAQKTMDRDAIFRIASQTKALTSVAIMILQEQGKLLINDPVGKYLPEFMETTVAEDDGNGGYKVVPANRKITIRDLLTHTAGIDYGLGRGAKAWEDAGIQGWYFADRDIPVRETIRQMATLPNAAQPGTKFVYGYNTDILGALIEVVSGIALDQFFSDNILNPLHMHDTYFYVPKNKADRVAKVYSLKGDQITLAGNPGKLEEGSHIGQGHYINGPRVSFSGGAGLVSTARDYGTFLQMLLNGGTLNGARILSPKTIELMTQNHLDGIEFRAGRGFGLGFEIITNLGEFAKPGSKGAYGWGGAYHSAYWIDKQEQLVVIYMTQLIPAGGLDDVEKLRALIYQAIID